MKAKFEGMRPGEPVVMDEQGNKMSLVLRLIPETPEEVAELRKFCRMTNAFNFVIDEDFRENQAHIAPVYGERSFNVIPRPSVLEELRS
jgi:hypothetical protein